MTFLQSILKKYKLLQVLILIDAFFVLLHLVFAENLWFFNLDYESNFPTSYQGLKLLTFGYFFFFICLKISDKKQKLNLRDVFWILTCLMFIYLGVDELAQIHENIEGMVSALSPEFASFVYETATNFGYKSTMWVIYYIPVFVFIGIPTLIFQTIFIQKRLKWKALIFIFGFLLLFAVPFIEVINTQTGPSIEEYNLWIALEEGFEMIGISMISFGYYLVHLFEKKKLEE